MIMELATRPVLMIQRHFRRILAYGRIRTMYHNEDLWDATTDIAYSAVGQRAMAYNLRRNLLKLRQDLAPRVW